MDALAQVPSTAISQLSVDCQEHFLAVIETARQRRELSPPEIARLQATTVALEEELGRFRMWANSIGEIRKDQESLEHRLINVDYYLRNNIKELLEDLKACLNDGSKPFKVVANLQVNSILAQPSDESPVPSNSSSGDETSDEESDERKDSDDDSFSSSRDSSSEIVTGLRQFYKEMVDIINKLFRLSDFIRGSSRTFRMDPNAAAYVEKDELGNDVLPAFKQFVRMKIGTDAPSAPKWLVDRLTDAIAMRRQQFYYQRTHKKHMSMTILADKSALNNPPVAEPSLPTRLATGISTAVAAKSSTTDHHTTLKSRISTNTTATELPEGTPEERRTATLPNPAKTEILRNCGSLPGSPKGPPDNDFECHQCFDLLPANYRNEDLWR